MRRHPLRRRHPCTSGIIDASCLVLFQKLFRTQTSESRFFLAFGVSFMGFQKGTVLSSDQEN